MIEFTGAKFSEKRLIRKVEKAVYAVLGQEDIFTVDLAVTDGETVREYNRETRGVDAETDVLSFPYFDGLSLPVKKEDFSDEAFDGRRVALGSIMISSPRAHEQAEAFGHSYERELGFLSCHGLLHLLGFDHMTEEQEREMNAIAEKVMDKGIPVLRDIPYIGKLLFSYNIFVYVAIVVAIIMWVYVMRTKTGLRVRAVGENPGAADACGVNVNRTRYINIVLGGGITGLGGLYLAFVINGGSWNEFWINGMGWIAVALVIFANWNPMKAIFGSFFFGMFNVLMAWKGNLSATFPRVLGWLRLIPDEFYQLLPFLITALVLVFASVSKKKKSAEPAAVGVNYFREER